VLCVWHAGVILETRDSRTAVIIIPRILIWTGLVRCDCPRVITRHPTQITTAAVLPVYKTAGHSALPMPVSTTTRPQHTFPYSRSISGVSVTRPRAVQPRYSLPNIIPFLPRPLHPPSPAASDTRSLSASSTVRQTLTETNMADPLMPTATSSWKKKTLDALGVTFVREPDSKVDFEFGVRPADPRQPAYSMPMPQTLQTRCSLTTSVH